MLIRYFKDPCPGREGIFMFTSDHQLRQLIFKTASDFSYGVNTLAIGTLKHKVRILCYTLMNNHLHLLVMGSYENCLAYFRWVLLRLAQMLKARYGISGILKANNADVQYVTDSQMFLNEVAYLLRNSFKAHIDSPYSYPWAPFEMYFNPYLENIRGERFPSTDAAMKILGTHALIPEDWEHRNGTILNKCFVDYRTAERLLGSGYTLFNRIRKFDTESAIAQSHGVEEQLTFTTSCRRRFRQSARTNGTSILRTSWDAKTCSGWPGPWPTGSPPPKSRYPDCSALNRPSWKTSYETCGIAAYNTLKYINLQIKIPQTL